MIILGDLPLFLVSTNTPYIGATAIPSQPVHTPAPSLLLPVVEPLLSDGQYPEIPGIIHRKIFETHEETVECSNAGRDPDEEVYQARWVCRWARRTGGTRGDSVAPLVKQVKEEGVYRIVRHISRTIQNDDGGTRLPVLSIRARDAGAETLFFGSTLRVVSDRLTIPLAHLLLKHPRSVKDIFDLAQFKNVGDV